VCTTEEDTGELVVKTSVGSLPPPLLHILGEYGASSSILSRTSGLPVLAASLADGGRARQR
jgi:hypothetical protein